MGAAYDGTGAFLGAMQADSAREVLDKLQLAHPQAAEFRIKTGAEAMKPLAEYDPPRSAPRRLSLDNIEHVFTYQPWNEDQIRCGREVTQALVEAAKTILRNVPECPTRTRVLNDLIDARMKANAAITHNGLY